MSGARMTPPPTADPRLLLEHAQWMRRLARSLVHDEVRAEDLTQETWTRLLARPPSLERPFRGWIATVMRNLVRAERRGSARREARERDEARPEATPSSHELVERAALQRELVEAVLELEEPYRSTILLRYFEERTPSAIAAHARVPLATVKTRLARGLARLRTRLAHTHAPDGQKNALAALVALAGPPRLAPLAWTALPIAMNSKLVVSLLALVAAALAYLYLQREPTKSEPSLAATELAADPLRAPPAEVGAPALEVPELQRESLAPETRVRESSPASAVQPAARVRGLVLDLGGAPVAGVRVGLLEPGSSDLRAPTRAAAREVATSGPAGAFELEGPLSGHLVVCEPGWTTLLAGVPVDHRSGQECRVVVAPSLALSGVVVDEDGVPIAGARVELGPPATLRARLAQVLDFSTDVRWMVASDADGRFTLVDAPALAEGVLRATAEGHRAHEEPAPLVARADLVLVLTRPVLDEGVLRGRVVDAAGSPVAAALVAYGLDTTETDERGRFALELDGPRSLNRRVRERARVPDDVVRALAPGHLPAEVRAVGRDQEGRARWPEPLVLELGSAPLAIEGRVVDERGEPLAGRRVWIADEALFGGRMFDPGRGPELVTTEALLAGRGPGWSYAESDGDGRFVLEGLVPRDYRVAVMDASTLQRAEAADVAAGRRDLVLVLPSGELFARLAGRIVDSHGAPVPGAQVFPMCDAYEQRFEGNVMRTEHQTVAGVATDAEGRFALERVPKDLVYLRIQGSDVIPLEWGRKLAGGLARLAGERAEELEIAVERRCHFQVVLAVPGEAEELGALDHDGQEMVVSQFHGNGRDDRERHALIEGRSAMLAVGDRAAELVLYRAGAEVRRVSIRLVPGAPTQLEL
jgi:RNA polymerase sigma-70 factor (ECF subfamily)